MKESTVAVSCGMEGCDHAGQIRFLGEVPFEGFKFDTTGWTVVEDTEDGRTVFLCADCAREFEEQAAAGDGGDDEEEEDDDDEEDEDDDDDAEDEEPRAP